MIKVLCEYKFANNKRIAIELVDAKEIRKRGLNKCDNFVLVFETGKGKRFNRVAFGLRADEMMQIATLTNYALWKTVSTYSLSTLRGYNGFKFNK